MWIFVAFIFKFNFQINTDFYSMIFYILWIFLTALFAHNYFILFAYIIIPR